ncbi:MAG: glycoside hydrolase family 95 protein [Butyrivibrio sp.]|jgi:alpha-L-fucosidase 2|nr:glycoside hydrolase family 95 protein [Butyrivibrio sp.]
MKLWYKEAAEDWTQALPMGNGILGGLFYGRPFDELIELNEDSVWSGGYIDRNNPDCREHLTEIRELIAEEKFEEAERLSRLSMHGTPQSQRCYQTLGNLELHFWNKEKEISGYSRCLSLDDALLQVKFGTPEGHYEREAFVSCPDHVMAMSFCVQEGKSISFDASLFRKLNMDSIMREGNDRIAMAGVTGENGIRYCAMLQAVSDGEVNAIGESLVITRAGSAQLYFTAVTSFRSKDPEEQCRKILDAAVKKGYGKIREDHISDYRSLYKRVEFRLGDDDRQEKIPTDRRIRNVREGKRDPGLLALYTQFGRYLLIASSRKGSLPANLQGIWCNEYTPAWDAKYTTNINIQMNYWFAENGNLTECTAPLWELMKEMNQKGKITARKMYGCRGSVCHHNTDLYGDTAPQDHWNPATIWVLGNAWMCYHIWEHYSYNGDRNFLENNFEIIEDQVQFFVDYMVKDENDRYVISPSVSPENSYLDQNGNEHAICSGTAMDSEVLDGLFTIYEKSCEILGKKPVKGEGEHHHQLAPVEINADGTIAEWRTPKTESEPGHRHFSPVFGLYPGENINMKDTPELYRAAEKTVMKRIRSGSGAEGWSCAWAVALLARLGKKNEMYPLIRSQIGESSFDNLLNGRHMLKNAVVFQIDGNLGLTAAVFEMLVQSHHDVVKLLPALPDEYADGSVSGLRLRNLMELSMRWRNGKVTEGILRAEKKAEFFLIINEKTVHLKLEGGENVKLEEIM